MSIRLIATDMDGTFLNNQHDYDHQRFIKDFKKLAKNGIQLVAASGSSYPRLRREFADVADQMIFISQNGSVIHYGDELIDCFPLDHDDLKAVLAALTRLYGDDDINQLVVSGPTTSFVDQSMDEKNLAIVRLFYENVKRVPNLLDIFNYPLNEPLTKISVNFADHIDITNVTGELDGLLPANLIMENSGFNTELIGDAHATKRNALMAIADQFNLRANEIMTFGDNENDLGMLTMTSHSYAMKNAALPIRLAAANVTRLTNQESGVLDTIERYFDFQR
ncbi:HAD family hydrolase [Limosilactobacillus mucosae]|uniref:HAD family hydrolase n=1 Tax=Limosilactobacillus mucosae TaxID=97478 RepID=A0AAJ1M8P8_LIMMU|nr:HAD family hydrolase [Limosilactobacillus mucosae]MDC2829497.1 HAD family hydrolase [Limosilactobacillus mucosae]MDC2837180.1 HAD family hydrolase [Limosilactobacillus mucosae]MDC2838829.1 HAD family hydrolase [Limosilactobacillus mucosae]MDC2849395.1 HAD family hydrolase [Limosilactobacillus mucosae]MDC2853092.1 HAD family hydrolase [Limosilactobacillus mucosae]